MISMLTGKIQSLGRAAALEAGQGLSNDRRWLPPLMVRQKYRQRQQQQHRNLEYKDTEYQSPAVWLLPQHTTHLHDTPTEPNGVGGSAALFSL